MNRLAWLLVCASSSVFGQWAQEPTSVLGITLGAPSSSIPLCPPPAPPAYNRHAFLCYEPLSVTKKSAIVSGGIDLSVATSAYVAFVDGSIASVSIVTERANYDRLRSLLVERYGPAHKAIASSVATNYGVLTSNDLSWSGTKTSIVLRERSERIDRSGAYFSYRPLWDAAQGQEAHDLKREASKL